MKVLLLFVLLCVVALSSARPTDILEYEAEDHQHKQEGVAGQAVTGEYSWTSPEGIEYHVKYVADDKGFRVVESNAVPVFAGTRADGFQGNLDGDDDEGEGEGEGEEEERRK